MRYRIAAIPLTLVALVVGGVAIALAGSGGAATKVTKAQAAAFIRAVELQPSDLPGGAPYVGEPGSPPGAAEYQKLLRCGHRGGPRGATVDAERSVLADRYRDWIGEVVGSVVIVMPTEVLAKAEIAALRSRNGHDCMTRDLRSSVLGSGGPAAPIYAISLTSPPFARVLGHEGVVLHLLARLQRPGRAIPSPARRTKQPAKLLYSVEGIFRVGVADIVFYVLSEHRQLPLSIERHLLTLLHDRAVAHKLSAKLRVTWHDPAGDKVYAI
jgi:hypothetical protein